MISYTKVKVNRLHKLAYHMRTYGIYYATIRESILSLSARVLANIRIGIDKDTIDDNEEHVFEITEHSNLSNDCKDLYITALHNIAKVHFCYVNNQPVANIEEVYAPVDVLISNLITALRTANAIVVELYENEVLSSDIRGTVDMIDNQTITIILDNLETQLTNIELYRELFNRIVVQSLADPGTYITYVADIIVKLCRELQSMHWAILFGATDIWNDFKCLYINDELLTPPNDISSVITEQYAHLQDIFDDTNVPEDLQYVAMEPKGIMLDW